MERDGSIERHARQIVDRRAAARVREPRGADGGAR